MGLNDNKNRNVPTLLMRDQKIRKVICGTFDSFILKESDTEEPDELFAFGRNFSRENSPNNHKNKSALLKIKGIKDVISGGDHLFILKESGKLFVRGYNKHGQLGLGDNENRDVPTLLMKDENIVSINEIITKIKWDPDIYKTLSKIKRREIKKFLLVCQYYKRTYRINVVKYMRHAIISSLF